MAALYRLGRGMVVERQMQESTPLMARKREQETLRYFFRVPGAFIVHYQAGAIELSFDFLPFSLLLSLLPGLQVGANSIPRSRHSFFSIQSLPQPSYTFPFLREF